VERDTCVIWRVYRILYKHVQCSVRQKGRFLNTLILCISNTGIFRNLEQCVFVEWKTRRFSPDSIMVRKQQGYLCLALKNYVRSPTEHTVRQATYVLLMLRRVSLTIVAVQKQ
jgi:hypothetical protein